jgi:hypothetical protein
MLSCHKQILVWLNFMDFWPLQGSTKVYTAQATGVVSTLSDSLSVSPGFSVVKLDEKTK